MFYTNRDLSLRIRIALAALASVASTAAIIMALLAAHQADQQAAATQTRLVEAALDRQVQGLEAEQRIMSHSDEAVIHSARADQRWLADHLGIWMHETFGHDRAYVLDRQDQPIFVMRDGKTAPEPALNREEAPVLDLAAELRASLARHGRSAAAPSARAEKGRTAFILLGERPALLSVQPIIPFEGRVSVPEGEEYLYASLKFLGAGLAEQIASETFIADAHFTDEHPTGMSTAFFIIQTPSGEPLTHLAWTADRPGLTIMKKIIPAGLVVLLILVGIALLLGRSLRQTSGELHRSEQRAWELATHDTLTGLPNRNEFEDRLNKVLARVRMGRGEAAILFLDMDRFKSVNDTLGHNAGDKVMRLAAARLRTVVGDQGTLARVGGDEFGLVLWTRRGAEKAAVSLAEKILPELSAPFHLDRESIHIGVSIGIAIAPDAATEREELLRKADIALYEAKNTGRARYRIFSEDMGEVLKRRARVESDLRAAMAMGDQLHLVYQPLNSSDGTILGAEALLRWNHPVHRNLSPGVMVSVAEESGLIMRLGDWVLAEAARTALRTELPLMSVNVSAVQLRDENFAERCLDILRNEGVEPSRIQIEVTEDVLIKDPAIAAATFRRLRKAGVLIAIDDFGTGYSSMNYLQNYPVDRVKIDRSFVQRISESEQGVALIAAMLEMGRALGLAVIAEGVETTEQRRLLDGLGCHEMQGHLFSRPLPAEALIERLNEQKRLSA